MKFSLPVGFNEPSWAMDDAPSKFWIATGWNASWAIFLIIYPLSRLATL